MVDSFFRTLSLVRPRDVGAAAAALGDVFLRIFFVANEEDENVSLLFVRALVFLAALVFLVVVVVLLGRTGFIFMLMRRIDF